MDQAEFRRLMDEAKERKNLSDILARHTTLKKRGRAELVGLCPFHQERSPSFEVNDAKGLFHCHGCGAAGDHFRALTTLDGLTFREAYEALTNDTFPDVDPAVRARQREEDETTRQSALADAMMMWRAGIDVQGSPAETYLRKVRGITMPLPPTIRFGRVPTSRDDDTGEWKRPYPAVLCACTDASGHLIGLQRIFLTEDGTDKRWGKRSKFSIGRPRGGAFKLAPAAEEIIACESPEDGMSIAQELPGRAVWVALGTAMLPEIAFPPIVKRVIFAGQNDEAGRRAVITSSDAAAARGLLVGTMFPEEAYKDWNDQLRGVRA